MERPSSQYLQPMPATAISSASRTHVGHVRKINEDRLLNCPELGLWAVADGMGGHHGGDIAAEMAIAALRRLMDQEAPLGSCEITAALQEANTLIYERGRQAGGTIGSTIVVLQVREQGATLHWVGDSRAYLFTKGAWQQVTHDHSFVQELLDAGVIGHEEALRHPRAHVITRALGASPIVRVATVPLTLDAGDRILLCSDGLSRTLDPGELAVSTDCESASDAFLAEALRRDGSDNITLVLIDMGDI